MDFKTLYEHHGHVPFHFLPPDYQHGGYVNFSMGRDTNK